MSIKENVNYVKDELSSEEKFLENFVKGERFFRKYKTLIFAIVVLAIIVPIGYVIKKDLDESNKLEANAAFNKFLESNDEKALATLKDKNEKLYEIALFLQARKDNKTVEINTPVLKELAKFQIAMESKNTKELENLSMQNDFLLKEFAIFNKALLLTNEGKFEEAKTALKQIPQTSKATELANLLNHYLLTK
jgi:predicted negative regulator of RcsB-dependent stress response